MYKYSIDIVYTHVSGGEYHMHQNKEVLCIYMRRNVYALEEKHSIDIVHARQR